MVFTSGGVVVASEPAGRQVGSGRVARALLDAVLDANSGRHWTGPGIERLTVQVCRTHVLPQHLLAVGKTFDVSQLVRRIHMGTEHVVRHAAGGVVVRIGVGVHAAGRNAIDPNRVDRLQVLRSDSVVVGPRINGILAMLGIRIPFPVRAQGIELAIEAGREPIQVTAIISQEAPHIAVRAAHRKGRRERHALRHELLPQGVRKVGVIGADGEITQAAVRSGGIRRMRPRILPFYIARDVVGEVEATAQVRDVAFDHAIDVDAVVNTRELVVATLRQAVADRGAEVEAVQNASVWPEISSLERAADDDATRHTGGKTGAVAKDVLRHIGTLARGRTVRRIENDGCGLCGPRTPIGAMDAVVVRIFTRHKKMAAAARERETVSQLNIDVFVVAVLGLAG